ncbi:ubiquinone biosynthesis accessory factor UbiJ [Litorilituus lipolyticus]|uniref:Ubiquinone biosynthesis accessory factor UbiJ n=1 Tax=Litorilituus lipolyticus TaxID=2491017 RepID=A0A502L5J1_9GAMM|nr:SCP2 sterol-binding domain-containing protein [Litorilituus lipolyticus]TPH15567.1 hypothetical protein EPA86_08275 [Litorilituus lipolyticus]
MFSSNRAVKLSEQLMVPQFICSVVELIINRALSLSNKPITLSAIENKTFTLELAELNFPLSITVSNNVLLVNSTNSTSDCTLISSIATLRQLKAQQQLTELIKQEQLDIQGDIKVAQQFARIAEELDIDWPTEVARHIGDVPTHKIGQLSQKAKKSISQLFETLEADVGEFLIHEKRLAVTNSEIKRFNQGVEQTSDQLTRIESRLAALENRLNDSQ